MWNRLIAPIRSYARKRGADATIIEDVVQEALLSIVRHDSKPFEDQLRIGFKVIRCELKRTKSFPFSDLESIPPSEHSYEMGEYLHELSFLARHCSLPPSLKDHLRNRVEPPGASLEEIAKSSGTPINTVRQREKRLIAHLKMVSHGS